jgi:hypothetical protein
MPTCQFPRCSAIVRAHLRPQQPCFHAFTSQLAVREKFSIFHSPQPYTLRLAALSQECERRRLAFESPAQTSDEFGLSILTSLFHYSIVSILCLRRFSLFPPPHSATGSSPELTFALLHPPCPQGLTETSQSHRCGAALAPSQGVVFHAAASAWQSGPCRADVVH